MKKISVLLLSLAMIFVLAACGNTDTTGNSAAETTATQEETTSEQASEATSENADAGYTVAITGCDYASNDDGNTAIICYFTLTNNTSSATTPAEAVTCQAFQDGMSLSQATISNAANYDNGASLTQTVDAGATVTCMVAYTQLSDAAIDFTVSTGSGDVTSTFEAAA